MLLGILLAATLVAVIVILIWIQVRGATEEDGSVTRLRDRWWHRGGDA